MAFIESAGITDVGKKRKNNEDALHVDDDNRLYIVADGMGGHQAGEVASAMVIETVRDYIKRFDNQEDVEELEITDETLSDAANRLLSGIKVANKGVYDVSISKEMYNGMGATLSAAYFTDDTMIVANVGDSPVYLVHNGSIELLSVIHNVMTEQAAIDPEAAKMIGKKFGQMLTRGMGIKQSVEPDICEIQVFKDDILVISSDGLSDKVSPEEILEVVEKEPPENACRLLVDMANERGGDDNITVITLKINEFEEKGRISKVVSNLLSALKKIFN